VQADQAKRNREPFESTDLSREGEWVPRDTHEGLPLWYSTEDTPKPERFVESGENLSVIAGVSPLNPSNTVSVRYCVVGDFECTGPRVIRDAAEQACFEAY